MKKVHTVEEVNRQVETIKVGIYRKGTVPQLWDGRVTERVVAILNRIL